MADTAVQVAGMAGGGASASSGPGTGASAAASGKGGGRNAAIPVVRPATTRVSVCEQVWMFICLSHSLSLTFFLCNSVPLC
jgi:hypothetical protein